MLVYINDHPENGHIFADALFSLIRLRFGIISAQTICFLMHEIHVIASRSQCSYGSLSKGLERVFWLVGARHINAMSVYIKYINKTLKINYSQQT